jgi:hypothetical protein
VFSNAIQCILSASTRLAAISLLCLLPFHKALWSAACCTSATAFGQGRLLRWETFAVGLKNHFEHELGRYDEDGRWGYYNASIRKYELRNTVWAMGAVHEQVSIFGEIPIVTPLISSELASQSTTSLGDMLVGARWQPIGIGEYLHVPGIALSGAVILPTADGPGSQVVTGRAKWGGALGMIIEHAWEPIYVQGHASANMTDGFGIGSSIGLDAGIEARRELIFSGNVAFVYESKTDSFSPSVGIGAVWRAHPNWSIQTHGSMTPIADGLGKNTGGKYNVGLGIRYGYF